MKVKDHDEQLKRQKAKEDHKQKLIEESKLPSRMEVDEKVRPAKKKKLEEQREKQHAKLHTFKPQIKKELPKFDELHSAFDSLLKQKKESVVLTQPAEFNFSKKQADSKQTADEDDGLNDKEREEQRLKQTQEIELQKKLKASSINTFLNRNFAPTAEKQVEAQKSILVRNDTKLKELQKQTANTGATNNDLIRQVVTPKILQDVLKTVPNIEQVFKASGASADKNKGNLIFDNLFSGLSPTGEVAEEDEGDEGAGGMFQVEEIEDGDQALPGMPSGHAEKKAVKKTNAPKASKKQTPALLFDARKPKVQNKKVDSLSMVTKRQEEVARFKEEKLKEQKRKEEEEKKRIEDAKSKKKKASERVHFKLEEVKGQQSMLEANNGPSIGEQFKAQTDAYEEDKTKMMGKVNKKACLVEASKQL